MLSVLTLFHIAAWLALGIIVVLLLLILFEPGLDYRAVAPALPLDSHQFFGLVAAVVDAQRLGESRVEVLTNGRTFYAAELSAIRAARHSIHIEAYVMRPGDLANRFLDALTERAAAGVRVRIVIDAIGSFPMRHWRFTALRAAGGVVLRYNPVRWYTLRRFNNRTHRELIVVDGAIGFTGGAGLSEVWAGDGDPGSDGRGRPWRDTMIRIDGALVGGLQTTFVENWLDASGEILADAREFPFCRGEPAVAVAGSVKGLVVSSTPSTGRATRARMLFQLLIAAARDRIEICSPYFVPDESMRRELIRAARRGVAVHIIVPGRYNDHRLVRLTSRRLYGQLLRGGVEIHEYGPAMTHAKIMIVDGVWCVLGSTNFDNRSFGLNDEINVAIMDRAVAARLREDFTRDLGKSDRITQDAWEHRSVNERLLGHAASVFTRLQ